jgi:hypothetical protein
MNWLDRAGRRGGYSQRSFKERDYAIGAIEIRVVMRNDDHRFATALEFRQKLPVKDTLKCRILIGRPFVEQVYGPVFEIRRHQRQPLALSSREFGGRELPTLDLDFVREAERIEVTCGQILDVLLIGAEHFIEKMKIREHGREMLAIVRYVMSIDPHALEFDASSLGFVQTQQQHGECRFTAAVASQSIAIPTTASEPPVSLDQGDRRR